MEVVFPIPTPGYNGGPCQLSCDGLQFCIRCDEVSLLDPELRWVSARPSKTFSPRLRLEPVSAHSITGPRFFPGSFNEGATNTSAPQDVDHTPPSPQCHDDGDSLDVATTPTFVQPEPQSLALQATRKKRAESRTNALRVRHCGRALNSHRMMLKEQLPRFLNTFEG